MAAVENNPPPMDAGGAEEERRFASSSVHATILGFLLMALVFVPIKITLDVEAAREKARGGGPTAPTSAPDKTNMTAEKLVAFGTVAILYLAVHVFELYIPARFPRLKISFDYFSMALGVTAITAAIYVVFEDFALKFMVPVELLLVVAILLKETPAGAYLIQQKRLYDLRKLREVMATAQAEVAQAELNVVEMQEPAGEEAIAAARELAVQKSVQLAVVRRQVAAAAVAAGVAQEIPNEIL